MRVKADFTVFPRKMRSGRVVYYYQTYDENGRRINGHSTGETTKTMAVKRCNALLREGKLLPSQRVTIPTFSEYARDWWKWDTCLYLKKQKGRRDLTEGYVINCLRIMNNKIVPYFGKMPLNRITEQDIDVWLVTFTERAEKEAVKENRGKTKLKNSYANIAFGILTLMLTEAVKRGIITVNPAVNVKKLKTEKKQVEILTPTEVKKMFMPKVEAIEATENQVSRAGELAHMANILAACTGMRIGEVLGMRGEYVYEDYIKVCGQYGKRGYGPTKTKQERNIPLTPVIMAGLRKLAECNGKGYLFSDDGGVTPISRYEFNKDLSEGLKQIGISPEEQKRRNLTPHAWRHFFNTTLRANNVTDAKVQSITGHASQSMTEYYTHFNTKEFAEVRTVQENLLLPEVNKDDDIEKIKQVKQL